MTQLKTKSFDKSISTGAVAQNDLLKYGYINVTFYKHNSFIGVDVAGFSNDIFRYYFKPENKKQIIGNQIFIESYINKCANPDEIKTQLQII